MKTLQRHSYLLIAFVALGCGRVSLGPERELTITREWPVAEIERLAVMEVDGAVLVEAAEGGTISLVAKVRGRKLEPKPNEDNQGLFQTVVSGDTLRISRSEKPRIGRFFFFGGDSTRVDYTLRVPPDLVLDLQTVNGRITTRGTDAEAEASTVNGPIDIEASGRGELSATTVNGRVRAKFLRSFQGARFKTVNGGVEAVLPADASFEVELSQVNGDFEASFPLSIRSNPGSRRVSGDVNGGRYELRIVTVNGDVALSKLGLGAP